MTADIISRCNGAQAIFDVSLVHPLLFFFIEALCTNVALKGNVCYIRRIRVKESMVVVLE